MYPGNASAAKEHRDVYKRQVYNLTCAFVDIPTKKTSQMMMLSRKQQGTKNEKLLEVYVTKIAGWIAPYLRLDRLKRNKGQRALDIAEIVLPVIQQIEDAYFESCQITDSRMYIKVVRFGDMLRRKEGIAAFYDRYARKPNA